MLGDLFQVVVLGTKLINDQVINRDQYLERLGKKKEEYNNMSESEKRNYNDRSFARFCRT